MSIWTPRTTVAAVIERDGHFLMVEEEGSDGGTVLNQPAGHLEAAETLAAAVRREVLEETGWEFEPRGVVGIYKWALPAGDITYVRYCFHGAVLHHHAERPLDADILRAPWMTADDITRASGRHRSPMVARCLDDYLGGKDFALELIHEID